MATTISYIDPIKQQTDVLSEHYIEESSQWEDKIYEIQETDYVHGGTHGYDNVPHEQLTNRTLFLKNEINTLNNNVTTLTNNINIQNGIYNKQITNINNNINDINSNINAFQKETSEKFSDTNIYINKVNNTLNETIDAFKKHTHNYAASNNPGGDAKKVSVYAYAGQTIYLAGTPYNDNTLYKTTAFIDTENALYVKNIKRLTDDIIQVDGNCVSADKLSKSIDIYFYGDVVGSCRTNFATNSLKISTTLNKQQTLTADTYGPTEKQSNVQLDSDGTFTIPKITINDKGIITNASNVTFSIPNEVVSGTTDAIPAEYDDKLYVVGAKNRKEQEHTFTYENVFIYKNQLYSNNFPVIDTNSSQQLINKSYNGYDLGDACEYGVETEIQGKNEEHNKLVTSHALFNHRHTYALADDFDGAAQKVVINTKDDDCYYNSNIKYLTVNDNNKTLFQDENVFIKDNELTCSTIRATDAMYIPGGKLWIDTSVNAIDGSTVDAETFNKISNLQNQIDILSSLLTQTQQNLQQANDTISILKESTKTTSLSHTINTLELEFPIKQGMLIAYTNKYILADNTNDSTCNNVMLVKSIDADNTATLINMGIYTLPNDNNNGADCYVGTKGNIMFTEPNVGYSKKIGYVEGNQLMFFPVGYMTKN